MSAPVGHSSFRVRNRRVAGVLIGWVVFLMIASFIVAWVR